MSEPSAPNPWTYPSSDVAEFTEAAAWFLPRTSITKDAWMKLDDAARRKAFTVANVANADLIRDVHKALDKAIAKGTTLADFKKAVGQQLMDHWVGSVANPAWRLETIFRTNVQMALSAGRYNQISDPDLVTLRPFWQYKSVNDNRVSPECEEANGTILPHDHPWWSENYPPRHFNCRCHVASLRRSEANRLGVTTELPVGTSQPGFGKLPNVSEWQPDLDKYEPQLKSELEARLRRMPEREGTEYPGAEPTPMLPPAQSPGKPPAAAPPAPRPQPSTPPPTLPAATAFPVDDPDGKKALGQFKTRIETKYPNRAAFTDKLVGGKDSERVGLLMKRDEIKANIKRLPAIYAQGQGDLAPVAEALRRIEHYADTNSSAELGAYPSGVVDSDMKDMIAGLLGHQDKLGSNQGSVNYIVQTPGIGDQNLINQAQDWYAGMMHSNINSVATFKWDATPGFRAGTWNKKDTGNKYNSIEVGVTHNQEDIIHEMGHSIEFDHPHVFDSARAFLEARLSDAHTTSAFTGKNSTDYLINLDSSAGFDPTEIAVNDAFYHYYCGKLYLSPKGDIVMTEVVTMGVQGLAFYPQLVYKRDPENFWWILGILGGTL